jgi:SAM-dependent methyltransferase
MPSDRNTTVDESVPGFYDELAGEYHLMFADWRGEVLAQGHTLDRLIRRLAEPGAQSVLDCACGIGTQAIGLAVLGYRVRATDLSVGALERAAREAQTFGVSLPVSVADFRSLDRQISETFDVVVCLDNAISHLLDDAELAQAASQMRARLAPGGVLLMSIRDYDRLLGSAQAAAVDPGLPGVRVQGDQGRPSGTIPRVFEEDGGRRIAFQVWTWAEDGRSYRVEQFFVREAEGAYRVSHFTSRFRALRREELSAPLRAAGFVEICWHMPAESGFYQPLVSALNR